jgi:putative oxidoreductase
LCNAPSESTATRFTPEQRSFSVMNADSLLISAESFLSPDELDEPVLRERRSRSWWDPMRTVGVLVVRATVGGLLAGHGAQKLLGWFEGGGMEGTKGMMQNLGLEPPQRWAGMAAFSELGGGLMTALGLLNPVGPLLAAGSMLIAAFTVHAGKPIWVTKGGAELPVTNLAALAAVMAIGPGSLSLDRALGIRLPRLLALPGLAVVGAMTWLTLQARTDTQQQG